MARSITQIRKRLSDGTERWYCYAWRGGPLFWISDAGRVDPARPPEGFAAAMEEARAKLAEARLESKGRSVRALADRFRQSAEFAGLAEATKETYRVYLKQIEAEFGDDDAAAFDDPRMMDDILAWRDAPALEGKTRAADQRARILSRLLNFGIQIRWLKTNPAQGLARLHDSDRSDIIWEPGEIALYLDGDRERGISAASPALARAFTLIRYTGLRRADAIALSLTADHGAELRLGTSKGRRKARTALIPVLPPLRALIDARRKTKADAVTVLLNSKGRPWTKSGLATAHRRRCAAIGVDKHLHDLRGTFATELMTAGFTDEEAAEVLGWEPVRVARIRRRYVNRDRLVRARIARLDGGEKNA